MADKLLQVAERVLRAQAELAAAEAEWRRLRGERPAGDRTPTELSPSPSASDAPVAERVRQVLSEAGRPLKFAEIAQAVPGAKREALKSALKKQREKGQVVFRQFKYAWK